MSKTKNRLKLPKHLLGVKIPKATRKQVNAVLAGLPGDTAKPLLAVAVGGLVTALAARLEQPLAELIEAHADPKKRRRRGEPAVPAIH